MEQTVSVTPGGNEWGPTAERTRSPFLSLLNVSSTRPRTRLMPVRSCHRQHTTFCSPPRTRWLVQGYRRGRVEWLASRELGSSVGQEFASGLAVGRRQDPSDRQRCDDVLDVEAHLDLVA